MGNFRVGNSRFSRFMNGKGFYIALAICLVAVGSAAYLAASNSSGLWNNNNNSSSGNVSPSSTVYSVSEANWGAADSTAQANNTVSGVPFVSSSSSSKSKPSSKPNSQMTNQKGEKLIFMLPCNGDIVTEFSKNQPVYDKTMGDYRVHNGVDITSKVGTTVVADADGVVKEIKNDLLLGNTVVIDHGNGLISSFSNLSDNIMVKKNQQVNAGDIIGVIGQSAQGECLIAPHLHYEMTKNNKYIDPLSFIERS